MTRRDSDPPSGDPDVLMDPHYAEPDDPDTEEEEEDGEEEEEYEDPIDGALALAKEYLTLESLQARWPYIVAFFVATGIVVGSTILLHSYDHVHWVSGSLIWAYIITILAISLARKWGSIAAWTAKKPRRIGFVLLLMLGFGALPLFAPRGIALYWGKLGSDIEQPKICTHWMVDTSGFEHKENLARWNPDQEKNREIRGAILISARMADLDTPELVTYEDCPQEKGRPLAFVIFQKVRTSMEVTVVPKEEKKGEGAKLEIKEGEEAIKTKTVWRSELKILFAVRSSKSNGDKESPFKLVRLIIPPPFDLDVKLLVDAFGQASGKQATMEDLKRIMGGSTPAASSSGGKG